MAKTGVYQENGQWFFRCPQTQVTGGPFADRDASRVAYQTHRQSLPPKDKVAGTITPAATSDAPEAPAEAATPAPKAAKKKAPAAKPVKKGKKGERFNGSVAKAWAIFDKHPKGARKAAVTEAIDAGINPNTAKTQYQRWSHRDDVKKEA